MNHCRDAMRHNPTSRIRVSFLLQTPLIPMLLCCAGCLTSEPTSPVGGRGNPEDEREQRRELLNYALGTILSYEQHDTPDMIPQAINRLDQWVRGQEPMEDWELDPMVATLPEPYSQFAKSLHLEELAFPDSDRFNFEEAVWLRDVSNWARGDAVDDLELAKRLFDWTVRNVQIAPLAPSSSGQRVLQTLWETLMLGQGSAADRAWVFMLLARQQNIDAALLALTDPDDPTAQGPPWVVSVLSEGELYLFDPSLGLPIPGPDGIRLDSNGHLDIQPATLSEVATDESLLRRLDVDSAYPYAVESSSVQKVIALLEASPPYLAQRMRLIESQLVGDDKVVLSTDAQAQAERFAACPRVSDARLWILPYRVIQQEGELGIERMRWRLKQLRPFDVPVATEPEMRRRMSEADLGYNWWTPEAREQAASPQKTREARDKTPERKSWKPALWKARMLHFKGSFTGEKSAKYYYNLSRIPNRDLENNVMPPELKMAFVLAKLNASYWSGLIAAHQGDNEAAVDWLRKRTLEFLPQSPRTHGAVYNLARVCESQGQFDKAIELYRADVESPGYHGNLLRARWLESLAKPKDTEAGQSEEAPENVDS